MIRPILALALSAILFPVPALAFESDELLIWINSDKGHRGLAGICRFRGRAGQAFPGGVPADE